MKANVLDLSNITDSSVDGVYFFGLIEHIVDRRAFSLEMKRILKNGGFVVGITPNRSSPWYTLRKIIRGTGKHCESDTYLDKDTVSEIFNTGDFSVEKVIHWGGVPAGVPDPVYYLLRFVEYVVERTFFRKYLGGITFKAVKK